MQRAPAILTLILLLGGATTSCRESLRPGDQFSAAATVDLGGEGCFVLRTHTTTYQPTQLPAAFQTAGLQVRFTARYAPRANTCMSGDVIELLSIRRAAP